jgi:hypothetical protein
VPNVHRLDVLAVTDVAREVNYLSRRGKLSLLY